MGKLLEVNDLEVSFKVHGGEVKAVRGVKFHVNKGETIGIVGESGCGKSVTAQTIMRLIPQPPARIKNGSIMFNGEDLLKKTEREMQKVRGKEIGMIFQDPMTSLNPTMTVGAQIMEPLIKHQNLSRKEATKRAVEMLDLVGMPNPEKRIKQYPHQFSGGMRQRAMIAIALACDPSLLIADEPTTALDVTIQAQILNVMKDLQKRLNTSIIMITHDLGVVAEVCDRVVVMYAGKVVEEGTVQEIFKNPQHPYTKGLLKSVPSLDQDKDKPLVPIYGTPPDLFSPPPGCAFCDRCDYAMNICNKQDADKYHVSDTQYARCWLLDPVAQEVRSK
ncbi:ABC transporter ATP-binding protein [Longirhabdus pacifica]|uniref:ABC transporter ATP-binding protein n=1 Tax=Longirhabdus pacifica TaxID=2305227 RepID=UPI0010090667|nr:ABC transporter ATP-binding protein [Longirhabdus pacifica]